jgi:Subtilase family
MRFKMNRNARSKPNTSTAPKQLNRRRIMRWLLTSTMIIFSGAGLSLAGWLFSNGVPGAGATARQRDDISPAALAQIEALIREKKSRAGAQQKMDSQLVYEFKMRRGAMIAEGVRTLETDLPYDGQGKVVLDLKARVSDALLNQLKTYGADIVASVPEYSSIRIQVVIDQIEAIAALPDVIYVQPKQDAMTSRVVKAAQDGSQPAVSHDLGPGFARRAAKVRRLMSAALQGGALVNGVRRTEGDVTHRAFSARGAFNVVGTGIKIGVLSDGVTNLAASQASGAVGPVTVLPGQAGSGDEGTAMLEIVHTVAPGAQLFFATAFGGIASFAQNILALRAAGCDIIVDDVFYFVETPFQDGQAPGVVSNTNGGVVIQAVNDVTASGALYFSSAGNSGNVDDGASGVWEGNFVDGGPTGAPLPEGNLHNFGGQNFDVLRLPNVPINLYWSDPLGGSSNDYDLFLLNADGTTVVAGSTNIQNGTQDPYEQINQIPITFGLRIVIVKKTGAEDRFLHLNTNRGRLSIATDGQTHGHSAAANAFSCAATPALAAFPNPFNSSNVVERFSSDGPRRIFFQADGTPITPGDLSATGGLLRQKPDITAADGVSVTGVGGFPSPFFGTSAAAPHAAAIAGLLKSANPSFTPAQIRAALTGSAIDIEAPGVDRDSGAGIIDAIAALQALGVPGFANPDLGAITVTENPGDGDGKIDPGESARLDVQLKNTGLLDATGITATLTTSTPSVTITQGASAYPDLPALGGSGTNAAPFLFDVASNAPCPPTINFTLTVSYTGGANANPKVFTFTVQPPPPVDISSTLDTIAPAPGLGFTTATGTIGVRHLRNGVVSLCGFEKAFPSAVDPGTRQFDAYTFATCPTGAASCVTVTLSSPNSFDLFTAAYAGSFNPGDISQNYLADAAIGSTAPTTYSFNIPAGQPVFTIVVYDVPSGPPSGSSYTLNISGACISSCPPPLLLPQPPPRLRFNTAMSSH